MWITDLTFQSYIVIMSSDLEWLRHRDVLVKDSSRVRSAVRTQDEIREVSGSGNFSDEVRKWRDKRN